MTAVIQRLKKIELEDLLSHLVVQKSLNEITCVDAVMGRSRVYASHRTRYGE